MHVELHVTNMTCLFEHRKPGLQGHVRDQSLCRYRGI